MHRNKILFLLFISLGFYHLFNIYTVSNIDNRTYEINNIVFPDLFYINLHTNRDLRIISNINYIMNFIAAPYNTLRNVTIRSSVSFCDIETHNENIMPKPSQILISNRITDNRLSMTFENSTTIVIVDIFNGKWNFFDEKFRNVIEDRVIPNYNLNCTNRLENNDETCVAFSIFITHVWIMNPDMNIFDVLVIIETMFREFDTHELMSQYLTWLTYVDNIYWSSYYILIYICFVVITYLY